MNPKELPQSELIKIARNNAISRGIDPNAQWLWDLDGPHDKKKQQPEIRSRLEGIEIQRGQPYSNLVHLREVLRSCQEFIWWADNYFYERGLEELISCVDPKIIRSVKILSSSKKITEKTKRDFKRFCEEVTSRGIEIEWRISQDDFHDRFIIGSNICYIAASLDTILAGNYAQIIETPKRPPFETWWLNGISIFNSP